MGGLIRPKIELDRAFMPVLITNNFDDDLIKNERASMETPFSHYVFGKLFRRSRAANSVVSGPIWPKFKHVRGFMHALITCKYKRIGLKATEKRWRHHFPHYKSMGDFCCHGHQNFDSICLKTLCSLSPPPVMLHIKFDQDLPIGLRDIQVRKCYIFVIQEQVISKVSSLIRPEIKLVRAFMPVLVTSNFDDDSIKNERASMETPFSHYKSMGNWAANSVVSGPI